MEKLSKDFSRSNQVDKNILSVKIRVNSIVKGDVFTLFHVLLGSLDYSANNQFTIIMIQRNKKKPHYLIIEVRLNGEKFY